MKGYSKLVITTIALSFIFLVLKTNKNELNSNSALRNLQLTEESYRKVCVLGDSKIVTDEFIDGFTPFANSIEEYAKNFTFYDDKYNDQIKNLVIKKDTSEVRPLVQSLFGPWIVFIIFGIFTLISWFFYCCCCCSQCCCCKADTKNSLCTKFLMVMMILSTIGLIILCIIGFVFSAKVPDRTNYIECSLLKFYVDFKYGQHTEKLPKWIGLPGIVKKIDEIINALDEVKENSQNAFENNDDIENAKNAYYQLLDDKYQKNKDYKTRNPNPKGSETSVVPEFIKSFGPSSNEQTSLGLIKSEYKVVVEVSVEVLKEIEKTTNTINEGIDEGKKLFVKAKQEIDPIYKKFEEFETKYINPFRENKEKVQSKLNYAFIGLFVVIIFFGTFFTLITLCYCCSPAKNGCRYFAHFLWQIVLIVTILIFILSGAFGLLGTAFIYATPFVTIVLSKEGMNVVVGEQASKLINVCLNGDGNMKTIVLPDSTYLDSFDAFYNQSLTLQNNTQAIKDNKNSQVISKLSVNYKNMKTDLSLAIGTSADAPINVILDLSSYTDNANKNSKIGSCGSKTFDSWSSSKDSCKEGYSYIDSEIPTKDLEKQTCLNINEWTKSNVDLRYSSKPQCTNINIPNTVTNYLNSLNNYKDDSSPIIDEIITDLTEYFFYLVLIIHILVFHKDY